MSILATSSFAQSPAPISSSPVVTRAWPSPSPSATPTTEDLINSLGQVDLQAVITLLKSNFTNPDAITDAELTRATVQDRKSTRLNSSHRTNSYAVFCL